MSEACSEPKRRTPASLHAATIGALGAKALVARPLCMRGNTSNSFSRFENDLESLYPSVSGHVPATTAEGRTASSQLAGRALELP
jgi:hypothetical protein